MASSSNESSNRRTVITPAVPELFEEDGVSAVDIRTETLSSLRELGPPDLVHLVKQSVKSPSKQVGVYHYVTGVDASSSASLAVYINNVITSLNDKNYKVISGLYCCYNAFSRLDMRVQVQIPGSMESYCIDERRDKRVVTEELWLEAYLCSVLRAYSYADEGDGDAMRKIVGCRRFNPITTTDAEHRFMEAAEKLFQSGWQLGSDPDIQVPNLVSNHLTTGLLRYIKTTGRYASGINLFEKLRSRDPGVSSLLAQVLIAADEEVKAVQLLHSSIEELPNDYSLLDVQAQFCSAKGRVDLAMELAKRGVVAAPSEFGTWARLAEMYIGLEQWDLALLTLNSCPMFTYQDKDAPRTGPPAKVSLPELPEAATEEIETHPGEFEQVHHQLRKLVAPSFKGTFQKAYSLLTEITKKIGWDQLLKIRSQVFVMEEEYRSERQPSIRASSSREAINGNGAEAAESVADSASTLTANGADASLEKPQHTVTSEAIHQPADDSHYPDPEHSQYSSFRHKRLCERWLDNLFMTLYEDLRIYTIWRAEVVQFRQQKVKYEKSSEEWEILGDLARRLHYEREAVEAYQECLSQRFSPKAMSGVMRMWQQQGSIRDVVGALIRLICFQYRWYSEFSPTLFQAVRRLIEDDGAVKIRNIVQATNLPQPVLDLTHQYGALCQAFHSSGSDN